MAAIEQACSKICSRLKPHLQQKSSTWETWQATVAQVQEGSGLTPASVMLSAYGFYDGTARDPHGRTTKGLLFFKKANSNKRFSTYDQHVALMPCFAPASMYDLHVILSYFCVTLMSI